ncbi:MAG: hypothetical protein ACR2RE_02620 [Geminicoccaceae bacterium]
MLDRLLRHPIAIQVEGTCCRVRDHAALIRKHVHTDAQIMSPPKKAPRWVTQ